MSRDEIYDDIAQSQCPIRLFGWNFATKQRDTLGEAISMGILSLLLYKSNPRTKHWDIYVGIC